MADGGKVPLDLQLATSVPLGIRAYRRRFMSPCTNLQNAGPDDYVNIYPDTSTPGSFIDPDSTYLVFDFTIKNAHFCVDYSDFGVEGVGGAIIQDWRVYNQGSILEEILEYGTVASALANIEGSYEQEVSMYFSSKLKRGFNEEMHHNFIKPPMVDASGNCMYGPNPAGIGLPLIGGCSQYGTMVDSGGAAAATAGQKFQASQLISSNGMTQLTQHANSPTINDFSGGAIAALGVGSYPFINTMCAGTKPSWADPAIADVKPAITAVTPMDFPDLFDPSFVDIVQAFTYEYGTINKPQVMANLCNVKCFPIGMIPAKNAYGDKAYGSTETAAYDNGAAARSAATVLGLVGAGGYTAPVMAESTYRICYRPYSGIFGKLATKMLATTLIAPQQMYINLHLASASIALNLSADPCRRISGTIRDYIRNVGSGNAAGIAANFASYGETTFTMGDTKNPYVFATSAYGIGYGPFHSVPITTGTTGITTCPNTIFNEAAASGRAVIIHANAAPAAGALAPLSTAVNLPPTPQYALVKAPNLFKLITDTAASTAMIYAAENEVFYGTYLKWSVPQVKRIFSMNHDGTTLGGLGTLITYQLSNINLAGDQLILPNEVTADIIAQAEAGNFNVHTNSVRTYNLQIQNATTQSIICPLKVNMAKRVLFVFQNNKQRNSTTAFGYDSNCGFNIFSSIYSASGVLAANTNGFNSGGQIQGGGLKGVGFATPLTYNPTLCSTSSIQVQLRVGNDFYPPQPLTTMQEIVAELCKTLEGWHNSTFSPVVDGQIVPGSTVTPHTLKNLYYDCLQPSKFTTSFIDNSLLDDQTITMNTDFVPLYCARADNLSSANSIGAAGAINSAATNGYNYLCPRGYCVRGLFKSPSSRFILGFNMRAFKSSDGCDGGTYLGNNTITLMLQGCTGLSVPGESYRAVAIVPHRVAMRYSPGGQIIWAY